MKYMIIVSSNRFIKRRILSDSGQSVFWNNLSRLHCHYEPQIEDSYKFIKQVWPLENLFFTQKLKRNS